jgi:hypothetical protein
MSVSSDAGTPQLRHAEVEGLDDVGGFGGHEGAGGDQEAGVVIDDVEDLDVSAVGQGPVGGVGLPALFGQLGLETPPRAAGPQLRLGVMKPRRDRTRQIVATDGTIRRRRRYRRCRW